MNDTYGILVLQSYNGLLLCSSSKVPTNAHTKYYIYNPVMRQHVNLPQPGQDLVIEKFVSYSKIVGRRNWYIYGASLAFDPTKSLHYKVVWAFLLI